MTRFRYPDGATGAAVLWAPVVYVVWSLFSHQVIDLMTLVAFALFGALIVGFLLVVGVLVLSFVEEARRPVEGTMRPDGSVEGWPS